MCHPERRTLGAAADEVCMVSGVKDLLDSLVRILTAGEKSATEGDALSYSNPKAGSRIRACDLRLRGALPKYPYPAPPAVSFNSSPGACSLIFILIHTHRLNPGHSLKPTRSRRQTSRIHANRESVHLLECRLVPVVEPAAFMHSERHREIRAHICADHQQIRFAVSRNDLAPGAVLAQVRVTHGSSIPHIHLAHKASFLTGRAGGYSRGTSGDGPF
jgi:hypothetical protein